MAIKKAAATLLIALTAVLRLSAQEKDSQVDSLVRLLSAKSLQLIEKDGVDYRKVTGPARFLHNDTYLICDTALWNVASNEIFAIDNVKILQDQTVLSGDRLTYHVDRDLAEFRGALVQLEDKDHNVLRTENLDYNTKDSVAVFFNGGSMKDKDGQVIESVSGTYDSKTKIFTFSENVNMFSDTVFVRTTRMIYDAGRNIARFGYGTDAWKDDNMLSSNSGWYDRNTEVFLFDKEVHGMGEVQEGWADSLYYYKYSGDIELLGNAQVTDTTRDVSALAGRIFYSDSLARIIMTRDPAVIGLMKSENAAPDTVYFGADTIISRSVMAFQIDSSEVDNSTARLDGLAVDAVQAYRQKAAKAAAEAAAKAAEEDPNRPQSRPKPGQTPKSVKEDLPEEEDSGEPEESDQPSVAAQADSPLDGRDSLAFAVDSLAAGRDSLSAGLDSLSVGQDSLSMDSDSLSVSGETVAVDSTKYNFITAIGNVKVYKSDIQVACDSLEYTDLDSLVRLYRKPLIWNEANRQYSADSVYVVIRNNALQKASLMSNAFIIVQEDPQCFDQIKATEMLAYFDEEGALRRFDALGDASAVFYLQEDSVYATVNKSAAKMLYATFDQGNLERVYYFEDTKNDAYPLAQMKKEERVLKGFNWLPDERPVGKSDITALSLRGSQRRMYAARPKTVFLYTDRYFPGYMPGVYKQIAAGKEAKRLAEERRAHQSTDTLTIAGPAEQLSDSLIVPGSSVASADSLSLHPSDSLAGRGDSLAVRDSLSAVPDSLSSGTDSSAVEPPVDMKAIKAAEKAAKLAAKEAKWARLDSLDAAKAQAKADKKAAKLRAKKLETLKEMNRQAQKDNARLEHYKQKYLKKKEREAAKAASRKSKNQSPEEQPPVEQPAGQQPAEPEAGQKSIEQEEPELKGAAYSA
ncbi:MAG: OstA-like protein [Candidatus Cryptobacteroides sp.]